MEKTNFLILNHTHEVLVLEREKKSETHPFSLPVTQEMYRDTDEDFAIQLVSSVTKLSGLIRLGEYRLKDGGSCVVLLCEKHQTNERDAKVAEACFWWAKFPTLEALLPTKEEFALAWQTYCEICLAGYRPNTTQIRIEPFGNGPEMAERLGRLILRGKKKATTSLLWAYKAGGEYLPKKGDLSVITDWNGNALCVIRTTEVETKPFCEVDEDFARAEGEGDGSLAYWRKAHQEFFESECALLEREATADMPVVCERFELVKKIAK